KPFSGTARLNRWRAHTSQSTPPNRSKIGKRHGRRPMTYMGKPYYPAWLDNLADDVTLEAAAMDGTAQGAEDVRSILVAARELYEDQEFKFAGPVGDYGFLEDY